MDIDNPLANSWDQLVWPEQSVLGAMLIDSSVVGLAVSEMSAVDFQMEVNREIFQAFRSLHAENRAADPVTVAQKLGDDQGVRSYLLQLMDLTPTASNLREYMAMAKENSRNQRMRLIGHELSEHPERAMELIRRAEDLLSVTTRDDESDMNKSMLDLYALLDEKPDYLKWGLPILDEALFIGKKCFPIIAGRPSDGKTALALHMAYHQSSEKNVGFFSLETGREYLFSNLVASLTGIPAAKIFRRKMSEKDFSLVENWADTITSHRLRLIDAAGWTVEEIEARTMKHKFDVIYIDYLQLIHPSSQRRSTRSDEVADISRALANMARRHDMTVVALSQLSRPANKDGKRREPVLADLRESGQIEQDADAVLFIWREEEQVSNAQRRITIAKNKRGRLGQWKVEFRGDIQRFIPEIPKENDGDLFDLPEQTEIAFDE